MVDDIVTIHEIEEATVVNTVVDDRLTLSEPDTRVGLAIDPGDASQTTTYLVAQTLDTQTLTAVDLGTQGPPGPPGPPGDAGYVIAAVPLLGHRVVTTTGVYADQTTSAATLAFGFITAAVAAGETVQVHTSGLIDWPAGGLTPERPLFLGSEGQLTHLPPATGWLLRVGTAVDERTASIALGSIYFLGDA